ncbi:MAG: hypothetical protein Q9190_005636 [Brigantiaea leucoxantha]
MAPPSRTPRGVKKREQNYENPGRVGRATGLTVPELGPRDEHGMEPMKGLFSSPEKSPLNRNGIYEQSTMMEGDVDETMDIESSSYPDPLELTGSRKSITVLPLPRSRSPMKTNLGSSPRRSMGPFPSPYKPVTNETPTRRPKSQQPNRLLDFSHPDSTPNLVKSTLKQQAAAAIQVARMTATPPSRKRERSLFEDDLHYDSNVKQANNNQPNGSFVNGFAEDSLLMTNGEDHTLNVANEDNQVDGPRVTQLVPEAEDVSISIERDPTPELPKVQTGRKAGRPSKRTSLNSVRQADDSSPAVGSARRGRPPKKKSKTEVHRDETISPKPTQSASQIINNFELAQISDSEIVLSEVPQSSEEAEEEEEEEAAVVEEDTPPPARKKGRKKGKGTARRALASKDPNTKLKSSKTDEDRTRRSPSKSRLVKRSETPGDELSFRTTRFGRNVMKPVAWWRGESVVYGGSRLEKGKLVLPSIKEVVRTEEVKEPTRRQRKAHIPRKQPPKKPPPDNDPVPEEEDEEEESYWETEEGIMRASVMLWDPVSGRGDEEQLEEAEVAYAASAIEMRDISGAEFRFAKTLSLPFFGSGIVDLPPGGTKRVKNSRKMQLVFFVFRGRVMVEMGTPTEAFSIGRGGMWQVPRGNFYSITNHSPTKSARIFFAQGCEVEVAPELLDESSIEQQQQQQGIGDVVNGYRGEMGLRKE